MQPKVSALAPAPAQTAGFAALLRNATLELPPGSDPARLAETVFAPGGDVYTALLPGGDIRRSVDIAAAVRRAGFNPVPHVAAREMQSRDMLSDWLAQLSGEAGVRRVLVIGGDSSIVRGPFHNCLEVLESGLLQQYGMMTVDLAGYPEGNYYLTFEQGLELLAAKLAFARSAGLACGVVTQFCLASEQIVQWLRAFGAAGLTAAVRIGLAGPATLATLAKFALRCGVGNSLRALRPRIGQFGRLVDEAGPDAVVDGLAAALTPADLDRVAGFHFYAFGGAKRASDWLEEKRRDFEAMQ